MKKIFLVGGGGHCQSCLDVIDSTKKYTVEGYIDKCESPGLTAIGLRYLGEDHIMSDLGERGMSALVAVGQIHNPEKRIRIYTMLKKLNINTPTIISIKAYASDRSIIGDGTIVMHGAVVNSGAMIGENCIINSMALIEHGASVGANSHISTGARINGDVTIGEKVFIGSGAIIYQGVNIGSGAVIQAGSVIKKDIVSV